MFQVGSRDEAATPSAGSADPPARPGVPVEPARLVRGLGQGRRWIVLGALVGGVAGTAYAKLAVHPRYEARVVVAWEPTIGAGGGVPADPQREFKTVVASVKLPTVLADARKRASLGVSLEELGKLVSVEPAEQANLFVLGATAGSPDGAVRLADAVVESFVAERASQERARLQQAVEARKTDLGEAERVLHAARDELSAFRKKYGVADLTLETNAAIDQISRLTVESQLSRADAGGETARTEALKGAAAAQPKTTVLSEREAMLAAEARGRRANELSAAESHLAEDHPKVEALKAEVAALERTEHGPGASVVVDRSVGRNPALATIEAGLTNAVAQRTASSKKAELFGAMLKGSQDRLERLSALEGEAATRVAEVHAAEGHVATLATASAAAIDAARTPETGLRLLERARTPEHSVKSSRKTVALAGFALGLLAGLLSRVIRALDGLRLHAPREVAWWARLPVVATSSWPLDADRLAPLARDLHALRARLPAPLVVPFSARESEAARALVSRWNDLSRRERRRSSKEIALAATGEEPAHELRHAARDARSVLVVVHAGEHRAFALSSIAERIGRTDAVGVVVIGVGADVAEGVDRVGELPAEAPTIGARRRVRPA
jgi:uncharacterized protein involved in exopolysaccharide biosynthesis